ncbi:MAG: type II and III secretion system protein, partial [Kiritimatiellaeota bacterium]|nr:type II and III secretion system protein [Kiritimatiellota bacterium]
LDVPGKGETSILGGSRGTMTDVLAGAITNALPQGLAVGVAHGNYTDAFGRVLPNVLAFVTALAGNSDVKILSNVPLWAQNNVEATVNVVDNIPIRKSTIEGGAGTARDVIQNIERLDVGIKLKFTPQVNPDNQVMMKRLQSVNKIPLLGDIPLIGFLFRSTSEKTQRTNLLIFVTPHIVSDMRRAMELQSALEGKTGIGSSSNLILSPTITNAVPPPPPAKKKSTLLSGN